MNASLAGLPVLAGLIATAVIFDFLNGLHDSANAIATVAATMGSGVVHAGLVDPGWCSAPWPGRSCGTC